MSQDKSSPFNEDGIDQEPVGQEQLEDEQLEDEQLEDEQLEDEQLEDEQLEDEQLEDEPISSAEPSAIQEFAHSIMSICTLESEEKLSSKESYQQIKDHWKELKKSRKKHKNKDKD